MGFRGARWLPALLVVTALTACVVGQAASIATVPVDPQHVVLLPSQAPRSASAASPGTARRPGALAPLAALGATHHTFSRTPIATATIPAEPVLTVVRDVIESSEPSPTPASQATELPPTPSAKLLDATFEDPDGFFSVDYPGDWIISPRGMSLLAPTDGGGLSMSIEIKAVTPEGVADRYADWYDTQVDSYLEMGHTQSDLGGYPAEWVEQSFTSEGTPYRGIMAAAVRNRVGFVLVGWSPKARYAQLGPMLRAMMHSLHISEYTESPPYPEWLTFRTSHFVFHYLPDTWISRDIKAIAVDHEEAFDDNVAHLELDYAGPIDAYLYASEESFYRATARDAGFAVNEAGEVHTRWFAEDDHQTPGHEITHVMTSRAIGEPSEALLGEGVAVWLDHGGNDYNQACVELQSENRLVPLANLLGEGWDGSAAAYYESGSFVGFLLNGYGVDRFKEVYTMSDLPSALRDVYRTNLAALERKWLDSLD